MWVLIKFRNDFPLSLQHWDIISPLFSTLDDAIEWGKINQIKDVNILHLEIKWNSEL